jgi:hypothetical protein
LRRSETGLPCAATCLSHFDARGVACLLHTAPPIYRAAFVAAADM